MRGQGGGSAGLNGQITADIHGRNDLRRHVPKVHISGDSQGITRIFQLQATIQAQRRNGQVAFQRGDGTCVRCVHFAGEALRTLQVYRGARRFESALKPGVCGIGKRAGTVISDKVVKAVNDARYVRVALYLDGGAPAIFSLAGGLFNVEGIPRCGGTHRIVVVIQVAAAGNLRINAGCRGRSARFGSGKPGAGSKLEVSDVGVHRAVETGLRRRSARFAEDDVRIGGIALLRANEDRTSDVGIFILNVAAPRFGNKTTGVRGHLASNVYPRRLRDDRVTDGTAFCIGVTAVRAGLVAGISGKVGSGAPNFNELRSKEVAVIFDLHDGKVEAPAVGVEDPRVPHIRIAQRFFVLAKVCVADMRAVHIDVRVVACFIGEVDRLVELRNVRIGVARAVSTGISAGAVFQSEARGGSLQINDVRRPYGKQRRAVVGRIRCVFNVNVALDEAHPLAVAGEKPIAGVLINRIVLEKADAAKDVTVGIDLGNIAAFGLPAGIVKSQQPLGTVDLTADDGALDFNVAGQGLDVTTHDGAGLNVDVAVGVNAAFYDRAFADGDVAFGINAAANVGVTRVIAGGIVTGAGRALTGNGHVAVRINIGRNVRPGIEGNVALRINVARGMVTASAHFFYAAGAVDGGINVGRMQSDTGIVNRNGTSGIDVVFNVRFAVQNNVAVAMHAVVAFDAGVFQGKITVRSHVTGDLMICAGVLGNDGGFTGRGQFTRHVEVKIEIGVDDVVVFPGVNVHAELTGAGTAFRRLSETEA